MNLDQLGVSMDNLLAAVQRNPDGTVTLRFLECTGNGAALVSDQSQLLTQGLLTATGTAKTTPTTALPRFANNVPAPTGAASAAAARIATVVAGDVVTRSWSTGDVDGVVLSSYGGANFAGHYVTLSATDIGTAQAAIRLTGTSDDNDRQRYFVGKGERVFVPFPGLQYIYTVAMDVDGSEDNAIDMVPV